MGVDFYPVTSDFEVDGPVDYELEPEWKNRSPRRQAWAIRHLNNVIVQFRVILKAVK